ncbi:MAG: T9SS type A sorting domain-containing protein [Bacteroidales bacterium]|nr:T9SS type A sorting domain-containing protein [Bacteroidales bacterium]
MKILYSLSLFLLLSASLWATENLTLKFSNPRIVYNAGSNYLAFDVLMKASAGGTYLYSSQVICNVNIANFNTATNPTFLKGFINGQYESFSAGLADKYLVTTTWNSNNLNIAVYANPIFNGEAVNSGAYNEVTTSYQVLGTVRVKISNTAGVAGINFQTAAITNYQKYATAVAPFYASYYNPTTYEGYDFTELYLARVFCGISSWTQAGGVVDWTQSVNTSVWDTTTVAAQAGSVAVPNANANGLRIHQLGKLRIPENRSLTCTGATDIKEPIGLVLGAGPTGRCQFLDNGTINYTNGGSVEAQEYFPQDQWHFYSIPLTQTVAWPYYKIFMKYFVESSNVYKYVVDPDSLLQTQMKGYAVWASSTCCPHPGFVAPVGTLNTGSISVPVTRTLANSYGYNLVGNPFASAIDLSSSGVSWGTNDPMAWFWDPTAANYFVFVKSPGSGTRSSPYCAPQQGFFVRHTQADFATSNFGVDNTARLINSEPFLKQEESISDLLEIMAESSQNTFFDKAVVRFANDATDDLDQMYDALKLRGSQTAPQLFSIAAGTQLSVNALNWNSETMSVPLGFACGETGTYSFTASNLESFASNVTIKLEDRKSNTTQDLRSNPVYQFSADAGENSDRFFLNFFNPSFGVQNNPVSGLRIYSTGDLLNISSEKAESFKGDVFVYDLLGNQVFQSKLQNVPVNSFQMLLSRGVYLVKVVSGTSVSSEKVLF